MKEKMTRPDLPELILCKGHKGSKSTEARNERGAIGRLQYLGNLSHDIMAIGYNNSKCLCGGLCVNYTDVIRRDKIMTMDGAN